MGLIGLSLGDSIKQIQLKMKIARSQTFRGGFLVSLDTAKIESKLDSPKQWDYKVVLSGLLKQGGIE